MQRGSARDCTISEKRLVATTYVPVGTGDLPVSTSECLQAFFERRRLAGPDGRPLYAYRCSAGEADALAGSLRAVFGSYPTAVPRVVAQAFCLWAANYWRQHYGGGAWSWADLLSTVRADYLAPGQSGYPTLCRTVASGLQAWDRKLLRGVHARLFLVTLACEGGLPLQLVTREHAHLRSYFRALFEEIRLHELTGTLERTPVHEICRQVSSLLPASLRQEVVFELSGRLATDVWHLLQQVRDEKDPLAALNQRQPAWRDTLPVDLPDNIASAFLNGLLSEATTAARTQGGTIRWNRALRPRRGASNDAPAGAAIDRSASPIYELTGRLHLPATLQTEQLAGLIEGADVPGRFDIGMRAESGDFELAAIGMRRPKEGLVTLEGTRRGLPPVRGLRAAESRSVVIRSHTGISAPWADFEGALPLSPLPWVFADSSTSAPTEYPLTGEGSVRVKAESALVAVPTGWQIHVLDGASCEAVGDMHEIPDRNVVRVSGAVVFADAAGARCTVKTNVPDADIVDYRLKGRRADLPHRGTPIFAGAPGVATVRQQGFTTTIPAHELRWRSDLPSATQTTDQAKWLGDGMLRHVANGEVQFATRIRVLPPRFAVRLRPTSDREGQIEFSGTAGAAIAVEHAAGPATLSWHCPPSKPDTVSLHVRADGPVPEQLKLRLLWAGKGTLLLELPFPADCAGFVTASGRRLPYDASIAVSQLGSIRATALVPKKWADFRVEGKYDGASSGKGAVSTTGLIMHALREGVTGSFSLEMATVQRDVAAQLQSSNHLDGAVRLHLRSESVKTLQPIAIAVTRYDVRLERDDGGRLLRLDTDALTRLAPEEIEALRCEAVAMLDPGSEPVQLERAGSASWFAPGDSLAPGPWLVVGWHGRWCRVRPILCDVAGEIAEVPVGGLRWACLQPFPERESAIEEALASLSTEPDHPDWQLIAGFVRWTSDVPTTTFDVLRILGRTPGAIALAAMLLPEIDRGLFALLWRALEELPFSAYSITRSDWKNAMAVVLASRYDAIRAVGADALLGWDPSRTVEEHCYTPALQRLTVDREMEWLAPVLDEARCDILGVMPSAQRSALSWSDIHIPLINNYWDAFATAPKRDPDSTPLPHAQQIGTYAKHARIGDGIESLLPRTVKDTDQETYQFVTAPAIAAGCAVAGIAMSSGAQIQLRHVHDHDPEWFRSTYTASYLFLLWHAVYRASPSSE